MKTDDDDRNQDEEMKIMRKMVVCGGDDGFNAYGVNRDDFANHESK